MTKGIDAIRQWIVEHQADGVLITGGANRYYLSGFTGSAGAVLIMKDRRFVISDFRYQQQIESESPEYEFLMIDQHNPITGYLKELGLKKIGVEEGKIVYSQILDIQKNLDPVELIPLDGLMERERSVKFKEEVDEIRRAAEITDRGWEYIKEQIRPGIMEKELALDLEFFIRNHGAEGISFPIITASGCRSSLPHGRASDKIIDEGDFVTIDFGCRVNHFCSDMTRTVVVGKASDQQKKIYETVLKAQKTALNAVRPGITGVELDEIARNIIKDAGFGEAFGHGLGHGVGLEVHELPHINHKGTNPMEPGMVITIEPGIYLPEPGGVRIEDLVVVTEDGFEVLSHSDKELLEIT
ncbi:MAG: aminopeptidase P family protein [Tindallia sp. MSAO_Bac2]|nr:MAG: aminopeptidase P family protein [Tindallia sp. MSAO_Bac2]